MGKDPISVKMDVVCPVKRWKLAQKLKADCRRIVLNAPVRPTRANNEEWDENEE